MSILDRKKQPAAAVVRTQETGAAAVLKPRIAGRRQPAEDASGRSSSAPRERWHPQPEEQKLGGSRSGVDTVTAAPRALRRGDLNPALGRASRSLSVVRRSPS